MMLVHALLALRPFPHLARRILLLSHHRLALPFQQSRRNGLRALLQGTQRVSLHILRRHWRVQGLPFRCWTKTVGSLLFSEDKAAFKLLHQHAIAHRSSPPTPAGGQSFKRDRTACNAKMMRRCRQLRTPKTLTSAWGITITTTCNTFCKPTLDATCGSPCLIPDAVSR